MPTDPSSRDRGRPFVRTSLLTALLCTGQSAPVAPTAQQPPRFRAGVELVLLDVSVLDAQRRPAEGLTAADFTVLEDGRPQTIQTFQAVEVPGRHEDPALAPWTREVASDVRNNEEFTQGRIVVLVLDDAVPTPAPDVLRVKDFARRAIRALGPADLAAVVFPLNQKAGVAFTHDRTRLLTAVDAYNGTIDYLPCAVEDKNYAFDEFNPCATTLYRATVNCLTDVARYLTALPDRRKALMFVSAGMPLDVGEGTPSPDTVSYGKGDPRDTTHELVQELMETFRAAQRAHVAIYSLDPGGLRAPFSSGVRSADDANPGRLNRDFLHAVAQNTGGFAVVDTNSADAGISQILLENSSYYLIGYVPASSRATGRFRRLEVRVNRPGLTVRTRSGYFEPKAGAKSSRGDSPRADTVLEGVLPSSDLAMQAMAVPLAQPGRREAAVVFVLAVRQDVPGAALRMVQELDVRVKAYSPDGRGLASMRTTAKATHSPSSSGERICEVASKLDLKPGRYQLRLAADASVRAHRPASDPATGVDDQVLARRSGSVFLDVDVPDFSRPLTMSAIMLSSKAAPQSGVDKEVRALLPIVPTTLRDLVAEKPVTAFVRVYQGGNAPAEEVKIAVRIVDGTGATVFQVAETLTPALFAQTRSGDYLLDLPIERLAEGPHLLTIAATVGRTTVSRELRLRKTE